MATPQTFIADIRDWASKFPQQMDALARQSCQQVSENVIAATPVDTGFLRGSWQPSIGRPLPGDGSAGAGAALAALSMTIPQMRAGETYYLTNNANYAEFVEFGTSTMQARYFVSDNVARWNDVVEDAARDLGLT